MKAKEVLPFLSKTSREQSPGKRNGKTRNAGDDLKENRLTRVSFKTYCRQLEEDMLEEDLQDELDTITNDLAEDDASST